MTTIPINDIEDQYFYAQSVASVTLPNMNPVPSLLDPYHQPLKTEENLTAYLHGMHALRTTLRLSVKETYTHLRKTDSKLSSDTQLLAHMDGGSMTSTTDRRDYLFNLQPLTSGDRKVQLIVADAGIHYPTHVGYLRVPTSSLSGYTDIRTYYTPSMPSTILSPSAISKAYKCEGHSSFASNIDDTCSVTLHHCLDDKRDIHFQLQNIRGLLFTQSLIKPTASQRTQDISSTHTLNQVQKTTCACNARPPFRLSPPETGEGNSTPCPCHCTSSTSAPDIHLSPTDTSSTESEPSKMILNQMEERNRVLWHLRLGHIHHDRIYNASEYTDDVPPMPKPKPPFDNCPICKKTKLQKRPRGKKESRHATQCNQGISIDMGFLVQKSKNEDRFERLKGIHGETCYCLIVDHHGGFLYGRCFPSKEAPVAYLNEWLAQHGLGPDVKDKYVRFDLGSELGRSQKVRELFEKAGYKCEPTAPNSSNQNGPGERPHRTIGDAIRAMLHGAGLDPKYWPYAFLHFIRIYNITPHGVNVDSPFFICTQIKPKVEMLRIFGCRVYVQPARPDRPDKAVDDSITGIFLGYPATTTQIYYLDVETKNIRTAQHVSFDKTMRDLPVEERPPNARLLTELSDPNSEYVEAYKTCDDAFPDIGILSQPFYELKTIIVDLDLDDLESPFGIDMSDSETHERAYIDNICRVPTNFQPGKKQKGRKDAFKKLIYGAFVTQVWNHPIYNTDDVNWVIGQLRKRDRPPDTIKIVISPLDKSKKGHDDLTLCKPPLHMRLNDLRHVAALQSTTGEGKAIPTAAQLQRAIDTHTRHDINADEFELLRSMIMCRLQTTGMTDQERALKHFTRRNLMRLPNWLSDWRPAFDKQLDAHEKAGTFGPPVPRSKHPDAKILRLHWANLVKPNGDRKARSCADGSKQAAPWLRNLAQTYASCIEQPCQRLFFSIAASESLIVCYGDTTNAFQQSPPPKTQYYLEIDDAYRDWYQRKFNKECPKDHIIPLMQAIQGHPEAGTLWQGFIQEILEGPELKLKSTTHERSLYYGQIDGFYVLVCRQVDDFAVAAQNEAICKKVIDIVNKHVTTEFVGPGEDDGNGLFFRYNGVDIHQTRDYNMISCETYIDRVLQTHDWTDPGPKESDQHDSVPLTSEAAKDLQLLEGPAENTNEHRQLETKMGFGYRQLLGELIYAYVICRLDIGFASTFLARYSQAPHADHYTALKNVCKYLRRTKHWGIMYWRKQPRKDLPYVPFEVLMEEENLPEYPVIPLDQLAGFMDAAHAVDLKTRRSVTGIIMIFAAAAIAFKSKLQSVVATSSTEAELFAAVHGAKLAKYFRAILKEIGLIQKDPTPLYEDNQAAIAIVNERRSTPRVRHVDIQHFAIQEWREQGDIVLHHIPGIINPSDGETKALGGKLHSRHSRRSMGHYGPPRAALSQKIQNALGTQGSL